MTPEDIDRLMDKYRENVRALFKEGSSDVVGNSSPRHATILIEEMIRHANETFVAFARKMDPQVWGKSVMDALEAAVKRGVAVRLLVESECLPIVNGTMPPSVRPCVRKLSGEVAGNTIGVPHFASGDGTSVRVETDPKDRSAVFAANNPEIAARVGKIFNSLYQMGEVYDAA